ncbi:hypothetical protein H4217_005399 [Coemansia sp. RSA 1939]|nr:hypothetical protein H4217_005399 [Coemansia sp. RSA 1939]KAJ2610902.1 hypothetical protein EV177_003743 [Coemansia sp. RSA 1804]
MVLIILTRKAQHLGRLVCSRVFLYEVLRTLAAWSTLTIMTVWMITCQQWSDMRWLQRFEHNEMMHDQPAPTPGPTPSPAPAPVPLAHPLLHSPYRPSPRHLARHYGGGHGHPPHHPFSRPWPQYALLQDVVLEHLPLMEKAWISDKLVGASAVVCILGCMAMSRGWRERLMMIRRVGWMLTVLYFFRSLTISVTTMPPSINSCSIVIPKTWWQIIQATPQILAGTVGQCTDKIFSGHTVLFTMSFLFLRTYATHWAVVVYSSVHATVGILSVLLARYHYTIDVVLAVLMTYFVHRTYYSALDSAIWQRMCQAPKNKGSDDFAHCYQNNGAAESEQQQQQQRLSEDQLSAGQYNADGQSAEVLELSEFSRPLVSRLREPSVTTTIASTSGDSHTDQPERLKQQSTTTCQDSQTRCSSRRHSTSIIDIAREEEEQAATVEEYDEMELRLLDDLHHPSLQLLANRKAVNAYYYAQHEHLRMMGINRSFGSILPTIVAWIDGLDLRC